MSYIRLFEMLAADVPTPPTDKFSFFFDSATGEPSFKDDAGVVTSLVGIPGQGVPTGGTTGQVLAKINGTDYNTQWVTATNYTGTAGSITLTGSAFSIDAAYVGQTSITTLGTVATGTWNATAISAIKGGTGQTVYAVGDLLYASTTTALSKLAAGTNTHVLTLAGGVPTWAASASGMTNPMTTTGDIIYSSSGSTPARLGVSTDGFVLTLVAGLPAWAASAGGGGTWGSITGTLSSQTDLQAALDAKITSLADPGADRVFFWDDSAGAYAFLTMGTNLTITGTTLDATGGGGSGDVVGPATATADAVAVYDGTTGKLLKDGPLLSKVRTQSITVACSDLTTNITTGTGKAYFRMPYAFTLTGVRASVFVAQTAGGILTFDINEAGTTILSTKLTIDNSEKTSTTAATPAVISDANIADDAEMTIDFDQVGTALAKGVIITLIGYIP